MSNGISGSVLPRGRRSITFRFVHYMEHPDIKEALAVGSICAEHIEQDYVGPRELSHVSQSCDGSPKSSMST